jgi:hypothetical protein
MTNGRGTTDKRQLNDATVVACLVIRTGEPEQLVELLRDALAGIGLSGSDSTPISPSAATPTNRNGDDPWLTHPEAAQYLGMATSTLYRYACQHRIESRKLCGRLEYQLSTLDRFKDSQIRPAARWAPSGRIIPSALGSGK